MPELNTTEVELKEKKARWRVWNNKRIAFVSILVSTSVVLILVFSRMIPIASVPSFKLMIGGLPIKLTGYIFGPFIGALTGVLSDVISFIFTPVFLHPWYMLAFAIAGFIPGFVGYFMNRRWRSPKVQTLQFTEKVNTLNFAITIFILLAIVSGLATIIILLPEDSFANTYVQNRWAFFAISLSGMATMLVGMFIFRFKMSAQTFNMILPIVAFSALLEVTNTNISALGSKALSGDPDANYINIVTSHLLLSPFKIWGNMLFILFAYKVVAPLIFNKTSNGW